MSGTLKQRTRNGRGGDGGGGKRGSDGDGEGGGGPTNKDDADKNKAGQGCGRKLKRVSLFRFRKVDNRRRQSGSVLNSKCWGVGGGGGGGGRFCSCIKLPMTVGSPGESPSSDPNSADFSHDMLRGLIEKNNFYDKECNVHTVTDSDVDSQFSPSSVLI